MRKTAVEKPPSSRLALVAIASNTGRTSDGELAMTFNISAVAVCRSSASSRSRLSRATSVPSGAVRDLLERATFGAFGRSGAVAFRGPPLGGLPSAFCAASSRPLEVKKGIVSAEVGVLEVA